MAHISAVIVGILTLIGKAHAESSDPTVPFHCSKCDRISMIQFTGPSGTNVMFYSAPGRMPQFSYLCDYTSKQGPSKLKITLTNCGSLIEDSGGFYDQRLLTGITVDETVLTVPNADGSFETFVAKDITKTCMRFDMIEVVALAKLLIFHSVKGAMPKASYKCYYNFYEVAKTWNLTLIKGSDEIVKDSGYFYTDNIRAGVVGTDRLILVPVANVFKEEFDLLNNYEH
ncbi:hypothetical protein FOL47_010116 [Perkinsus chesapeaki]|uniref:Uncharacterized protein n=1 Tax=Perkinsus chesapeaki TaxID=330153 RepID=A0A7J6L3T6_PERCH|nr:hypothetical protein FOL47_010116 [Perkinsus chesapeaki]